MMEVACARRPIWTSDTGEALVLAAWQGGSIIDAVESRLYDSVEEIELVLRLGVLCSVFALLAKCKAFHAPRDAVPGK